MMLGPVPEFGPKRLQLMLMMLGPVPEFGPKRLQLMLMMLSRFLRSGGPGPCNSNDAVFHPVTYQSRATSE